MGKVVCGMTGGYESPAYASWGCGVTSQAIVTLMFLLLLRGHHLPPRGVDENQLQFADQTTFTALASTHAVCAGIVCALSLLGYLFSSCFLCPLGLLSIGVQAALLATCGICGSLLTASVSLKDSLLSALRANTALPVLSASETFVLHNEGSLLFICILCLVAVVPFSRGVSLDTRAPAYEALLYGGSVTFIIASASVFIFIRAVPALAGLSTAWMCVALGTGLAIVIQKWFCSRILAIGLSAVFLISAVFGIVSTSAISAVYIYGKEVYVTLVRGGLMAPSDLTDVIKNLPQKQFDDYRVFALTSDGVYLIAAICLNLAATMHTAFAGLNCMRTVFSCERRPEKNADDSDSDVA